jgi:hypothetical protein
MRKQLQSEQGAPELQTAIAEYEEKKESLQDRL